MKKSLIIILAFASISVVGQVVNPPKQDKKVSIVMSIEEVNVVIKALETLPYKESAGIIASIIQQGNKQLADTTIKKK